jgi:triosephosphate isomerase
MKPMLIINFKAYEQGVGKRALSLAGAAEKVAKDTGANIVLSVQPYDIGNVASAVSLPVYAQHMDPIEPGSRTGWILPQGVKEAGAKGTLINHSEHQMDNDKIRQNVEICRKIGIKSVCCAATPEGAGKIAAFSPDFIAIEPTELIGGDVSVSSAKPELISDTVRAVKGVNPGVTVLCGAGVNQKSDVEKAIELGAHGLIVASAIVKSENPEKEIAELVRGFG